MSTARELEEMRRVAASEGVPMDCLDRLVVSPKRAAHMLDVSLRTVEHELDEGKIPIIWVRKARRISLLDLVEYMSKNRGFGPRSSRGSGDHEVNEFMASFRSG